MAYDYCCQLCSDLLWHIERSMATARGVENETPESRAVAFSDDLMLSLYDKGYISHDTYTRFASTITSGRTIERRKEVK